MEATLLVEILTEELPPKSLRSLSEVFMDRLFNELTKRQLTVRDPQGRRIFATPRRIAALIPNVFVAGQDREQDVTGPPTNAPAQAIAGVAKKQGVAVSHLGKQASSKGEVVVARLKIRGLVLEQVLAGQ